MKNKTLKALGVGALCLAGAFTFAGCSSLTDEESKTIMDTLTQSQELIEKQNNLYIYEINELKKSNNKITKEEASDRFELACTKLYYLDKEMYSNLIVEISGDYVSENYRFLSINNDYYREYRNLLEDESPAEIYYIKNGHHLTISKNEDYYSIGGYSVGSDVYLAKNIYSLFGFDDLDYDSMIKSCRINNDDLEIEMIKSSKRDDAGLRMTTEFVDYFKVLIGSNNIFKQINSKTIRLDYYYDNNKLEDYVDISEEKINFKYNQLNENSFVYLNDIKQIAEELKNKDYDAGFVIYKANKRITALNIEAGDYFIKGQEYQLNELSSIIEDNKVFIIESYGEEYQALCKLLKIKSSSQRNYSEETETYYKFYIFGKFDKNYSNLNYDEWTMYYGERDLDDAHNTLTIFEPYYGGGNIYFYAIEKIDID